MLKQALTTAACAAALMALHSGAAQARDQIRIVGSSTVFPFSTAVAEEFGRTSKYKAPIVESTGTGGGFKLFCSGLGFDSPDISDASRPIKKSEIELCAKNGVTAITEIKIGYDGIVLANDKAAASIDLSLRDIYLALAKHVPAAGGDGGKMVPNPYKTWKQVNPSLPDMKIEVLGPPPTSGTRDAFTELAMEGGCGAFPGLRALEKADKNQYKKYCTEMREDGAFIEAGENDNLIVQKLQANHHAFGIFGYSYLEQNSDVIQGSAVGGEAPTFENISSGAYPISRSLYIYVKNQHVDAVPGMRAYLEEYASDKAWGEYGYLTDKGLIPMPEEERANYAKAARDLKPIGSGS